MKKVGKNLGKTGRDKITGYTGIITAEITYLYGCSQYGIVPKVDKDGKVGGCEWFDDGRIEIIGDGVKAKDVMGTRNGGVNRDCPTGGN